ncbi:MAG: hypothetical protein AAB197_01870, partial [Deltaproteobacteria bacterium]
MADKKIEEKRVKPTVIRRRAVGPTETEREESAKKAEEAIKHVPAGIKQGETAKKLEAQISEQVKKPVKGKKAVKGEKTGRKSVTLIEEKEKASTSVIIEKEEK